MYQSCYSVVCPGPSEARSRAGFLPSFKGLQGPLSQDAESVLRAKAQPPLPPLTYQVAAPPAGLSPARASARLLCIIRARSWEPGRDSLAGRWGAGVVGGLAHIPRLHSELVERWQRGVGSQGPCSRRRSPTEPIAQGHPPGSGLGASESGWGLRGGANEGDWPWGFLGDPGFLDSCLLSFPG